MPWARRICFRLGWVAFVGFAARLSAAEPDAAGIEFFERKLRPLLAENCFSCHGPEKQKAKLRLDSLAAVLKGSEDNKILVPGKSAESLVVISVARLVEDDAMPPADKGEPLTKEQVGLIRSESAAV